MNPNLAAAVERLKFAMSVNATGDDRITICRNEDLETILAELGRGEGGPVAIVHTFSDGKIGRLLDRFQSLPEGTKLFTRPPVAGLAELTDEQWYKIFRKMQYAYDGMEYASVAKAAREFLGKVE